MTSTISRFEARLAPCGKQAEGEQHLTEDQQGLVTERSAATTAAAGRTKEEFHDGSVHHHGRQPPRQGAGGRGAPR